MGNLLDSILDLSPILKDILKQDISIVVADTEKVLYYCPGFTLNLNDKPGRPLKVDEPLYKAIKTGKSETTMVPKEVFGISFMANAYPIKDAQGNVIGGIGLATSLDWHENVEKASQNLFSSLQLTNESIGEIVDGSQKLVHSINSILNASDITKQKIKESDTILNFISSISSQSNLLAINGAIEAARAGKDGQGFSVIAGEMRKLSQMSSESADKINQILLEMRKSMEDITKEINMTNSIAEVQAETIQEITAALQQITSSANMLAELSKIKV